MSDPVATTFAWVAIGVLVVTLARLCDVRELVRDRRLRHRNRKWVRTQCHHAHIASPGHRDQVSLGARAEPMASVPAALSSGRRYS
jgi:hypothetical protein